MPLADILRYIFLANFGLIALEYAYSYYKKDDIYSFWGAINNVANGIILNLLSPRFYGVYFIIFSKYYNIFHIKMDYALHPLRIIVCLLFVDLMYYIFHRVHHAVYLFWTFHIVHHSDHKLNLSTAERISWFEQIYIYIFFIPVLLAGFSPLEIFFCFYTLSAY
jgi:sterol desaturase/sphingolipid hydroxylase (fatty acid hydroxylase superfamily)